MKSARVPLVFDPADLTILFRAFDDAWRVVKAEYDDSTTSMEVGRLRVANAVIAAYQNGLTDADLITAQALDSLNYRRLAS